MITTHAISSLNAATRPSVSYIATASRQTRRTSPRLSIYTQLAPFSSSPYLRAKPKKPSRSSSTTTASSPSSSATPKFRVANHIKPTPPPSPKPKRTQNDDTQHHAAFLTPATTDPKGTVNPVSTVRPPALDLPEKPSSNPGIGYYFSLGKAYVSFYKTGLQNAWANYRLLRVSRATHADLLPHLPPNPISVLRNAATDAARMAQDSPDPLSAALVRARESFNEKEDEDPENDVRRGFRNAWRARAREVHGLCVRRFTRAEVQLVLRTERDVWRLLPFLCVLLVCGEFTPLVVMSGLVKTPETCVLPAQREKRRMKLVELKEERCKRLGLGLGEGVLNMVVMPEKVMDVVQGMREEELKAACELFGVQARAWAWPVFKTSGARVRLADYMRYLVLDDALIVKGGGVKKMVREEVEMAVWQRGGVEVGLGLSEREAERDQRWWLERWVEGSKRVVI